MLRVGILGVLAVPFAGCGSFNSSFLNLLNPTGEFQSVEPPPGHVVITVLNNAEIDEQLVTYLAGRLTTPLTDAELRSLRPRLRLRARVTFRDNSAPLTVEFITGTKTFVDPSFDAQTIADLNQNDLDNIVVLCDVASVQIDPEADIEVFVPVPIAGFELVEVTTPLGGVFNTFELRESTLPQFRSLNVDTVDDSGNTLLRQNIDIRDVPTPVANVICGSVVTIVVDGVLSVPFLGANSFPSFDRGDVQTNASIGGRYEFRVSVR